MSHFRIATDRLRKGMVIKSNVYSHSGAVLVPAGTAVTKEVVNLLTRHFIDYVIAEHTTTFPVPQAPIHEPDPPRVSPEQFEEFKDNFQIAEVSLSQTFKDIVENHKDIDVPVLLNTLNGMLDKSNGEANLCDMLYMMKQNTENLYTHSINVSLFGQILAKWIDCTSEEIELVTLAGLLHDIGIMKFSEEELSNFTFRDELEKNIFPKHSVIGYNMIKDNDMDIRVKQAVLTHHERLDGSGHPLQLPARNINKISRILAIADVYDTLTMKEDGVEHMSPFTVLKRLEDIGFNKLDDEILMTFASRIAHNLIQHKVQLSNGQTGQILLINKYNLSKPLVLVGTQFIDLALRNDLSIIDLID